MAAVVGRSTGSLGCKRTMSIGTVILGVIVVVFVGFAVINWLGARTYRPTAPDIANTLQRLIDGELTWKELDDFSCVRIAYDKQLDSVRERCNRILDAPGTLDNENNSGPTVRLTERGQAKIGEIVHELEALAT